MGSFEHVYEGPYFNRLSNVVNHLILCFIIIVLNNNNKHNPSIYQQK